MNDRYFGEYSSDGQKSGEEIQERLKQQKYEEIIRKQKSTQDYIDEYEDFYVDNRESDASDYNDSGKPPSRKRKKSKKGCGCGCGCGTLLIIILLIFSLVFGGLLSICGKTNFVGNNNFDLADYFKKRAQYYNVLLIGTDKDDYGTSRSDSMILVTIDDEHKELKFTSFMRDTWVEIPDHGEAKLNAAYAYGGAELLMDTIEMNFKVNIDNYVMVDFEMFKKLIDAMGGVRVEITEEEAEFINRTTHAKVTAGENTLDGDYALIYCRIRKLDSDFMRTQRQRKVMTALFQQVVRENPLKTFKGMTEVLPLITTDISPFDMTIKALTSIKMLSYSNDDMRVPVDGSYENRMVEGQDALVPDLEENQEALQEFVYESDNQ